MKHLLTTVLTCFLVCSGTGTLLRAASLSDLTPSASAIVVGGVTSRVQSASSVSFDINVERVLSGAVSGRAVHVFHQWRQDPTIPIGTFNYSLHGIWFLTAPTGSAWDVLPATTGFTVASLYLPALAQRPSGAYKYPDGSSLQDVLTYEIAAGVVGTGSDPGVLLEALGTLDSAAIETVLANLRTSQNPALRAVGLAGSVLRAQPGALTNIVQMWPNIGADPHSALVVTMLRDAWRASDATSVEELSAISGNPALPDEIRSASLRALSSIHTPEALPALAALLNSPSPSEQTLGIFGLASFANGCPIQTRDNTASLAYLFCNPSGPYGNQETLQNFALAGASTTQLSKAISFWQQWWNSHPEVH